MKRTTYILIGLLLFSLVALAGGIFCLSFYQEENYRTDLTMPEGVTSIDATRVHSVKFCVDTPNERIQICGSLNVRPSQTGSERFNFPKDASQYCTVNRVKDTLLVNFHFDEKQFPEGSAEDYELITTGVNFTLDADSTLVAISNEANRFGITLSKMKLDTLSIRTMYQIVRVDSCTIRALDVAARGRGNLDICQSRISDFYLDLDGMDRWMMDGRSEVITEHLTGSGKCTNNLERGECKRVFWTPKGEGAELTINVKEKATVLLSGE